jgi:RNA polymerase-binding transcription factor DksA
MIFMVSKADAKRLKKMLIEERDRLISSIRNIEEASRTESGHDNGADLSSFAETGTDNFNLETALNIAGTESKRLRDVMDALLRIEKGTYGICEGSGKPIPLKRLEAFPSARYCVEYQEQLEKESSSNLY